MRLSLFLGTRATAFIKFSKADVTTRKGTISQGCYIVPALKSSPCSSSSGQAPTGPAFQVTLGPIQAGRGQGTRALPSEVCSEQANQTFAQTCNQGC